MTMNSVNDRLASAEQDGLYEGLLIGQVVENNDPLGIARIKVRIPNVFDPDQGPVPWCLPSKHSLFGQGPGYGTYGTPKVGSHVRVSFQGGDPQHPVYEADEYLAKDANTKFSDPNTWGFKDPGGSELFVNYQTGAWEFTHQSGTTVKYDGAGDLSVHVAKDLSVDVVGTDTTTIGGDSSNTVQGNQTTSVQGNQTVGVQGNQTTTVQGASSLTADSVSETANSSMTLTAQTLTINASSVNIQASNTSTSGVLSAGNGATGVFTSKENKIVTVLDGIVISIT